MRACVYVRPQKLTSSCVEAAPVSSGATTTHSTRSDHMSTVNSTSAARVVSSFAMSASNRNNNTDDDDDDDDDDNVDGVGSTAAGVKLNRKHKLQLTDDSNTNSDSEVHAFTRSVSN